MDLATPLTSVRGIGPARAGLLEAKGLVTVEDLLGYVPFRYEDRSNVKTIAQLAPGEMATVIADVRSVKMSGFKRRSLGMFEARFTDASRAILAGKWFHGAYLANVLGEGMKVALFGKVEFDSYAGELSMLHPEMEILSGDDDEGEAALHVGRIVPVYEGSGKLTTRAIRTYVHRILKFDPARGRSPAAVPARPPEDAGPLDRDPRHHFPPPDSDLRLLNAFRSPAQFRMIYEEFFWLECGVALKRGKARTMPGIQFDLNDRVREKIKAMLPFKPTGAQKRVLGGSRATWRSRIPLNDCCRATWAAAKPSSLQRAAVIALENGYQVAVLAPTEILAAQHGLYFKQILGKLGYVWCSLPQFHGARKGAAQETGHRRD
jgi:ATP-dependent DNA helicase RecG